MFLSKYSEQLPGSRLLEGGPPAHHLLAQPLAPMGLGQCFRQVGKKGRGALPALLCDPGQATCPL